MEGGSVGDDVGAGLIRREDQSLAEALRDCLDIWSARTGVAVEIWALPKSAVPRGVADGVYAVVVDALADVERRERVHVVSIAVTMNRDGLRLTLSHDGDGTPPGGAGHAFAAMCARFAEIGGSLTVTTVPGGGTTISGVVKSR
jgi:signal transduction histidine kinase